MVPVWLCSTFYTFAAFYLFQQLYIAWNLTRDILICGLKPLHRILFVLVVWTLAVSYISQFCVVNVVWVYQTGH